MNFIDFQIVFCLTQTWTNLSKKLLDLLLGRERWLSYMDHLERGKLQQSLKSFYKKWNVATRFVIVLYNVYFKMMCINKPLDNYTHFKLLYSFLLEEIYVLQLCSLLQKYNIIVHWFY